MEEFSELIGNPELLLSAITASATPLPGQSDIWDECAGVGIINYDNVRDILSNGMYQNGVSNTSVASDSLVLTTTVGVSVGQTLQYSLAVLSDPGVTVASDDRITPNFTKYRVEIYDGTTLVHTNTETYNILVGYINNTSSSSKSYTIKVYKNSAHLEESSNCLSLSYYIRSEDLWHIHSYTYNYESSGFLRHKAYCKCGSYIFEEHTISEPADGSVCVYCGYEQ